MALRAVLTPQLRAQFGPAAQSVLQLRRQLPQDSAGVVVAVKLSAARPDEAQQMLQLVTGVLGGDFETVVEDGARW